MNLLYKDEVYAIIGAAMDVHNELDVGFLEAVYQEALEYEFSLKNIPARKEMPLQISYKGRLLSKYYVADFICYDKIIVELKVASKLNSEHMAQTLNYLKATGLELGVLIKFGHPQLEYQRIVWQNVKRVREQTLMNTNGEQMNSISVNSRIIND